MNDYNLTDEQWRAVFRAASEAFFSPGCKSLTDQVQACAHAAMRATETTATAPLLARVAELEAALAEASKDAERLDWLEKRLTGASDSERYLPLRVYWGDGRGIRKAIDERYAMTPPEQPK